MYSFQMCIQFSGRCCILAYNTPFCKVCQTGKNTKTDYFFNCDVLYIYKEQIYVIFGNMKHWRSLL